MFKSDCNHLLGHITTQGEDKRPEWKNRHILGKTKNGYDHMQASDKSWKGVQCTFMITAMTGVVVSVLVAYYILPHGSSNTSNVEQSSSATQHLQHTPVTELPPDPKPSSNTSMLETPTVSPVSSKLNRFIEIPYCHTILLHTEIIQRRDDVIMYINAVPKSDESLLTEDDIINTPHKSGPKVVELCIKKLKSPIFNMPDDNDFMRRVAYVMSEFGGNMKGNGGIWQVSHTAFEDTKDTRAHIRLPRKYEQIWKAYKIDWDSVTYKDLDKPFYSALAARLYLSNFPEYIPPADRVEDQAAYWKFKYMTGKGDIQRFKQKVEELERTHPY